MGLSGEIKRLSVTLNESEQRCTDLDTINSSLLQKLKSVDENLEIACETNRVTAHRCNTLHKLYIKRSNSEVNFFHQIDDCSSWLYHRTVCVPVS